ncbi:MAG: SDR family oxidoreductase [Proteobacteria bacterium]|nr:SDR family oxidoreductase [Pseudomonadota bacterium]
MEDKKPTVVVAGATGRAGRLIVDELLKRGIPVRAMIVRPFDPPKPAVLDRKGIEIVEGSLESPDKLQNVMAGADYVISAIGSTKMFSKAVFEKIDVEGNKNLAVAAKENGVKRIIIISSIGAGNSKYAMTTIYRWMMLQVIAAKTKMEEIVKAIGIDYTFIRPGGYTEKEVSGGIAIGEGGKISGLIRRDQVAQVCVDAVENQAMSNRTFEVCAKAKLKKDREQFLIEI